LQKCKAEKWVLTSQYKGNLLFFENEYKKSVQSVIFYVLKRMVALEDDRDLSALLAIINLFHLSIKQVLE